MKENQNKQNNQKLLYTMKCRTVEAFISEQTDVCKERFEKLALAKKDKAPELVIETEKDNCLTEALHLISVLDAFENDDIDKASSLVKKYIEPKTPEEELIDAIYGYDAWKKSSEAKPCQEDEDEADEENDFDDDDFADFFDEDEEIDDEDETKTEASDCDACEYKNDCPFEEANEDENVLTMFTSIDKDKLQKKYNEFKAFMDAFFKFS